MKFRKKMYGILGLTLMLSMGTLTSCGDNQPKTSEKDSGGKTSVAPVDPTPATITLNKTSAKVYLGGTEGTDDTLTLTATIKNKEGKNVTSKNKVTWASSDATIVTVDKGVVKAVAVGTAKITASVEGHNDIKAEATIIVENKITLTLSAPDDSTGATSSINLDSGNNTVQLTATITNGAANQKATWSSSDENIATVDETGLVTAKDFAEGESYKTVTITATTAGNDGDLTANCIVTIIKPSNSKANQDYTVTENRSNKDIMSATYLPFQWFYFFKTSDGSTGTVTSATWTAEGQKLTLEATNVAVASGKGEYYLRCKYIPTPQTAPFEFSCDFQSNIAGKIELGASGNLDVPASETKTENVETTTTDSDGSTSTVTTTKISFVDSTAVTKLDTKGELLNKGIPFTIKLHFFTTEETPTLHFEMSNVKFTDNVAKDPEPGTSDTPAESTAK